MTYGIVNSLVRASVPAVVLTVFALARRYFPPKPVKEYTTAYSLEQLNERFKITQWLVGISMLLIGGAVAWGTHSILANLNQFFAAMEGPSYFVLLPQTAIWWFLPGFAAITLTWEITLGAWYLIGNKQEAELYNHWSTLKSGFDTPRVLWIMAVVIVLPIAVLTALAIPEHVALRNNEIHSRGYGFSSTRTYRYAEARRMTVIKGFRDRDGVLGRRAGIVLDFSDGRRWSSADIGDFKYSADPKLVSFLQSKTGLQLQYADTESDIPGEPGKK
ncbi:MAG: hypothetical protein ABSG25_11570 [Bryobacteraceae bacterium]